MFNFGASSGASGSGSGAGLGSLGTFGTAFTIGSAGVAAYQVFSGIKAKKQAKKAGKAAARLIKAETQEQLRRMRFENRQTLGLTTAATGASGLHMAGSTAAYRYGMEGEMRAQEWWTQRAGDLRARAAKKQGGYIGQAAMRSAVGSAINTIGQTAMTGYQYGWWGNTQ